MIMDFIWYTKLPTMNSQIWSLFEALNWELWMLLLSWVFFFPIKFWPRIYCFFIYFHIIMLAFVVGNEFNLILWLFWWVYVHLYGKIKYAYLSLLCVQHICCTLLGCAIISKNSQLHKNHKRPKKPSIYVQSKLCNVVEHTFAVKHRFPILQIRPRYLLKTQAQIVVTCCVMYN